MNRRDRLEIIGMVTEFELGLMEREIAKRRRQLEVEDMLGIQPYASGKSGREPELTDVEAVAREAARCQRWGLENQNSLALTRSSREFFRGFAVAMEDILMFCDMQTKRNSEAIPSPRGEKQDG